MTEHDVVEVEIGLHRRDSLRWAAEVRVDDPGSGAVTAREGQLDLDLRQLEVLEPDTAGYAEYLSEQFFADPNVRAGFTEARRAAAEKGQPMRVRLRIGPSAPDLHRIRWELLRDPEHADSNLMTQQTVVFSRYLESRDYRKVDVRPKLAMRALVAVAGPTEASLAEFKKSLAPIHVEAEIARAREALAGSEVITIGDETPVTLDSLIDELRKGADILYLVCHGYVKTSGKHQGPRLVLQNEDGSAAVVAGREFVRRLRELLILPRLIVLASCESSAFEATADDGALAAVGPEIAAVGVPAVIAMQANISMKTVEEAMPKFFEELGQHGIVDRAFSVARGHVRDRPDWWVPVLFMRLKSGRIWYSPGFAGGVDEWPMLLEQIERAKLTPILGPGLTDPIFGSRRELARTWARTYKFPIPSPLDEDLPQVAQYVAKIQGETFLRDGLRDFVGRRILTLYAKDLAKKWGSERLDEVENNINDPAILYELVNTVGRITRADRLESHNVLATLPMPVYLTTEVGRLLSDAVSETDSRTSQDEFFHWTDRDDVDWGETPLADPATKRGSIEEPLVYHLFGDLARPGSVVLTEDDYFEFLTSFGTDHKRRSIPTQIQDALVNSSLLFVGFRIDDWDFRVLFRAIMSLEGSQKRRGYRHVAVQLDPEESSQLDPERVRSYFERYFGSDFTIYWGSSDAFLHQLAKQWDAKNS